jgi:TFIIF-interacting CTD phosphatase-like protein
MPAQLKKFTGKKTLVIDLDETLIHSGYEEFSVPADFFMEVRK